MFQIYSPVSIVSSDPYCSSRQFAATSGLLIQVPETRGKVSAFGRFSGTSLRDCRRRMIEGRIFVDKINKRGRPRIRTAEYWREYYTRKQREWRAAHPRNQSRARAQKRAK